MKLLTLICILACLFGVMSVQAAPKPKPIVSYPSQITLLWDNPTNHVDGTSVLSTNGYTKITYRTNLSDTNGWIAPFKTAWPATSMTITVTTSVYEFAAMAGEVTTNGGLLYTNESEWTLPLIVTNMPLIPMPPTIK